MFFRIISKMSRGYIWESIRLLQINVCITFTCFWIIDIRVKYLIRFLVTKIILLELINSIARSEAA